jgi:ribosomal protein S8
MNIETIKFLNQLKNASLGNLEKIKTRSNNLILILLKVLYKEGYILSFRRNLKEGYLNETSEFLIHMKNPSGKQLFKDLRIISTSSNQKYFSLKTINRMESKRKLIVFSTDKGILTLTECKRNKVGGILLFVC